jgi:hypothetical protein
MAAHMRSTTARSSSSRGSFRPHLEQARLRPYVEALHIDEAGLTSAIKPLMSKQDREFRAKLSRGVPHNEALLVASRTFNDQMQELCTQAVLERDRRAVKLASERGTPALEALRTLGVLDPPWRRWKRGEERTVVNQLADNLDETRPNREYSLRSRLVRTETSSNYSGTRLRPRDFASPMVEHVLTAHHVARLRSGETLVLDPSPSLLPPEGFAACMADLLRIAKGTGATRSGNPCNEGSFHGMLPINASTAQASGLSPHTCALLRQLGAIPHLIERHGWPRPLMLPAMVQLGYYPGGTGARYRPHLDRWASEVNNRREITILVYVNVGWDAQKMGGCLRLHPDPNSPGEDCVDVEPLAGRLVVFESGKCMHEVCEAMPGCDRLALTLWVEYEEAWQQPERNMMPVLK